jgi:hypothetical protein
VETLSQHLRYMVSEMDADFVNDSPPDERDEVHRFGHYCLRGDLPRSAFEINGARAAGLAVPAFDSCARPIVPA